MNQNRKAELQRKLSMTSVPKPPAGLAERLKADIPENLMSVERDRARLSRSTAFSMRVAASIILLVTSVYVALHMVSRTKTSFDSAPPAMIAARKVAAPPAEVTITLAENKKDVNSGRVDEVDRVATREEHQVAVFADERAKLAKKKESPANEAGQIADAHAAAAPTRVPAAPAPVPPPPPTQPVSVAEAADRSAAARNVAAAKSESITVPAAAPAIVGNVQAADFSYARPRAVFGLSIDPTAFDRMKHDIENGDRPAAGSVDVSALVNYFAGNGRAPRHDVRLDVEASRAPLATDNRALVRFTVDTPREEIAAGSVPPVATNASLEITLNSTAVLSHRLIGADVLQKESTLLKNVSVTGLMDMRLKPGIPPRTTIATLTLTYRSVADGRHHEIVREVHAADVTRTWATASRRHRLATLGAVWSESLNGERSAGDVATTAERLATEKPEDDKARDLAAAATASSRLRNSGPTGSER